MSAKSRGAPRRAEGEKRVDASSDVPGVTGPIGGDCAVVAPPAFAAETSTRTEWPSSSLVRVYVESVAPSIGAKPPLPSQRSQEKVRVAAGSLQVPGSTVKLEPTIASPATDGATVGTGTGTLTGEVRAESALPAPPAFVAVTVTLMPKPESSPVTV